MTTDAHGVADRRDDVGTGGAIGSPWRVVLVSMLAGVAMAILWSPAFVDTVIAGGIADPVFGESIRDATITGSGMAMAFAFMTGFAGMFTACNVAVFSALAPMSARTSTVRRQVAGMLRPIGWLLLGAVVVSGLYGVIGVLFADSLPQLSEGSIGGVPARLLQASIVFGLIGLVMLWRGLAYAGVTPNPFAAISVRHPRAEIVFLGGLIGAFLIGRPFPPFRNLFAYAAETRDPLLGFVTFALQSIGNVLGVVLLFVLLTVLTRGGFQRWLHARPGRHARFAAGAFLLVGAFLVVYWGVKLGHWADLFGWPRLPYQE
ncbi:hypothetical protein [Haloechinothrix halophila]|uniref:hypothetical protein n=1 Tax=Haloechinothrix halophila TaxID=1069073 RepID=UPI0004190D41|nr:hypothetical protein [Haloechinothrix halophila]